MRDRCIFPGVPTSVRFRHLPAEIAPELHYWSRSVQFAVQYRQISASVNSSPRSTHFSSQSNQIDEIPILNRDFGDFRNDTSRSAKSRNLHYEISAFMCIHTE